MSVFEYDFGGLVVAPLTVLDDRIKDCIRELRELAPNKSFGDCVLILDRVQVWKQHLLRYEIEDE